MQYIMDLWRWYSFLRFAKSEIKRGINDYGKIRNAYRKKKSLSETEIDDLWNEVLDNKYVYIHSMHRLRITAQGKSLIGGGLYGYINTLLKEKASPLVVLAGLATVISAIVIIINRYF